MACTKQTLGLSLNQLNALADHALDRAIRPGKREDFDSGMRLGTFPGRLAWQQPERAHRLKVWSDHTADGDDCGAAPHRQTRLHRQFTDNSQCVTQGPDGKVASRHASQPISTSAQIITTLTSAINTAALPMSLARFASL